MNDALMSMFKKQTQIIELLENSEIELTPLEIAVKTNTNVPIRDVESVLSMYYSCRIPEGKKIQKCTILLIENDEYWIDILQKKFKDIFQAKVIVAYTSEQAYKVLTRKDRMRLVNVIILDMKLPKDEHEWKHGLERQEEGEKLLKKIASNYPYKPLLIFSSLLNVVNNPQKLSKKEIRELVGKLQEQGVHRAISKDAIDLNILDKTLWFLMRYSIEPWIEGEKLKYKLKNGILFIENYKVFWEGTNNQRIDIHLETKQLKILRLLILNQGQVVSYPQFRRVFGEIDIVKLKKNLKAQIGKINAILKPWNIKIQNLKSTGYFLPRDVKCHFTE